MINRDSLERKLLSNRKINPVSGCWEWTKAIVNGYGMVWISELKKNIGAHRASAYLWLDFDIMQPYNTETPSAICHKCDNPICFNPDHLFVGTARDNIKDARRKGRGMGIRNRRFSYGLVREIRHKATQPYFNQSKLARQYGVSQATIYNIVRRNTYRDID